MKVAVVRTEDVWIGTVRNFTEIDYNDTCIVNRMRDNISRIYEYSLPEIVKKKKEFGNLAFISTYEEVLKEVDVIHIAVRTLVSEGGYANLKFVEEVVTTIALTAKKDTIVVTKSTVPVGTNDRLLQIIGHNKLYHMNNVKVPNPFLNNCRNCIGLERTLQNKLYFMEILSLYPVKIESSVSLEVG